LALLGIMIPTALRFQRRVWVSRGIVAVCAFLTFAMLTVPFPQMPVANLLPAAMAAAMFLWVYTEFGVLGAITAFTLARPITVVGVLLIQPASGLHSPGFLILGVLGAMGILAFIGVRLAPEPAIVLPGETGARAQARTRREELISEFNVARSAQQQMLPSRPPVLPGYTLSASCEPAREVGGDLYDFLSLGDGRWGIGVADVSGKGVPAALYMTLTKGLLCAASQDSGDPREILKSVNLHLREVARRKVFVTMALGVLDPEARTLEYARAGHNPVVWRRAAQGETRLLSSNGIGLGISSHPLFARTLASEKIELGPGDALVFYSDGLTEAMDKSLEQFGEERLIAAVESADGANAEATRDSILKAVRSFLNGIHPQDDLTIAVLRVNTELENGR
jgi:serine phosphatase RsbU (regulator of sigma subunit)